MSTGGEWKASQRAGLWIDGRSQRLTRRREADALLVESLLPDPLDRVLDLGTGDGHLLELIKSVAPGVECKGIDISPPLLRRARERFAGQRDVEFIEHDLARPLPDNLGRFGLVVSALAIHHLPDERKRGLYGEVLAFLRPGAAFYNLDLTAAPSETLHALAQEAFGFDFSDQDPSDQLSPLASQLGWLRDLGYQDVDCHWKWFELALFGGLKQ
jgi:tRNA (cmo5U34)-methyltransferase